VLGLKTHENYPHPIKVSSCLQVRAILRRGGHGGRIGGTEVVEYGGEAEVEESALKDAQARKDPQ